MKIIRKIGISLFIGTVIFLGVFPAQSALLDLSNVPVFQSTPHKPNVLLVLDNSNSMDEMADGSIDPDNPVTTGLYDGGSASPSSKSEISRTVMKGLISDYQDKLNMGLMAYKQNEIGNDPVKLIELHNAFIDLSYSASDFNSSWEGALDSQTKKFKFSNPADATNFFYSNVTAPFYSVNNEGASFCYSPTAQALHTIEDPLLGPWDTYRCFASKVGSSNALPIWQDAASEAAAGYSNYKYQFQLFPTDSDLAKGIYDFGKFLNWGHIGKSWYSNGSPGRGYLHVPIAGVDNVQKSKLDTKLETSQFTVNAPTDITYPLQNAGLTPLEGTLGSAKDYFQKKPKVSEGFSAAVCNALPDSCDKDYVILVTDGLPSVAETGQRSNDISKVEAAAAALLSAGVKTYVIGFALPFGIDPTKLDSIAAQGGTDRSYQATDADSLEEAMHAILSDIIEGEASATPVSLSSQNLTTATKAYLTSFNSADWTGNIRAYGFTDNALNSTPDWEIKNSVTGVESIPDHASRNIVTYKRVKIFIGTQAPPPQAVEFKWSELSQTQQNQIGSEAIINYLRGDESEPSFRYRSGKLGDIIHSEPIYVKPPAFHYPDFLESGEKYSTFKADKANRTAMLYVGANDGMLHAFNAETGVEKFAYIPSVVFNRITRLSSPAYAHEYFVDGTPIAVDAYFNNKWHTILAGGLRAGGQGIYAIDVTDPDLSTPTQLKDKVLWEFSDSEDNDMGYSFSEPNIVRMHHGRWAAAFGNGYNNTEDDNVIATDTNVSTTGHAVLYLHELENGKDMLGVAATALTKSFIKISTGVGDVETPNGLASIAPVDVNGDNIVDYVYAGDLLGNLWKFDFTKCLSEDCTNADTLDKWKAQTPTLLFKAEEATTGYAQPITVRPEVGRHRSEAGLMIYFGTGKYIETTDNTRDNQVTQAFYGIWDNGSGTTLSLSKLQERKILTETVEGYRLISSSGDVTRSSSELYDSPSYTSEFDDDLIQWGDVDRGYGWYINMKIDQASANNGERIINRARLKDGRILFTSIVPTADSCEAGGEGYLIEVDAMQGSRSSQVIYDINNDGNFNDSDRKTVTINGVEVTASVSGLKLNVGIPAAPAIIGIDGKDAVLVSGTSTLEANEGGTSTDVQQVNRYSSQPIGRQSWRQCY